MFIFVKCSKCISCDLTYLRIPYLLRGPRHLHDRRTKEILQCHEKIRVQETTKANSTAIGMLTKASHLIQNMMMVRVSKFTKYVLTFYLVSLAEPGSRIHL